jgi:hypothetical protein
MKRNGGNEMGDNNCFIDFRNFVNFLFLGVRSK